MPATIRNFHKEPPMSKVRVLSCLILALNAARIDNAVYAAAQDRPPTTVQLYDIRAMLIQFPDFTGAPHFAINPDLDDAFAGDDFNADDEDLLSREELIEQVTTLIQDTVGEQSDWVAYGGTLSSIRELKGRLIIRTTPDNHAAIANLLDECGATALQRIVIEAWVIQLPTQTLQQLRQVFGPTLILEKQTADTLQAAIEKSETDIGTIAISRVVMMDGQRVNTVLALQRPFVSDLKTARRGEKDEAQAPSSKPDEQPSVDAPSPVQADDAAVSPAPGSVEPTTLPVLVPVLSAAQEGVVLDIEGTLTPKARQIVFTVRCSIALQSIDRTFPASAGRPDGGPAIEAATVSLARIRTSLTVPNGGGVLLGASMTRPRGNGVKPADEVLLFLRAAAVPTEAAK